MFPDLRPPQDAVRHHTERRSCAPDRSCAPAEARRPDCCPLPTPKQGRFLSLTAREAFYGGAAGGGKSTALLIGALEHIHVPGYSALILRRDLPRLSLAGGLIPRSHEWLAGTSATWNARRCQWIFPTGGPPATITFGFLHTPLAKFRYGSSEYQYIAFDELTEFEEEDYLFLFSRLRKARGLSAPLRVRAASNPGGPGHAWVKSRFVDLEALVLAAGGSEAAEARATGVYLRDGRGYIPARIADNPHLCGQEYRRSLMHLPPVTRERLLNGDWTIQAASVFHEEWLRYYVEVPGELHILDAQGRAVAAAKVSKQRRFCTIDPAIMPASEERRGGRPHSYSVIQVWDQPAGDLANFLFLRHQFRAQVEFPELVQAIRHVKRNWQPQYIYIEKERVGTTVCQMLDREQIFLTAVSPEGKDKLERAGPLILKFECGEILLPKHEISWLPDFQSELLAWTGGKREPCDQIDAAAYAAIVGERNRPRQEAVVIELG